MCWSDSRLILRWPGGPWEPVSSIWPPFADSRSGSGSRRTRQRGGSPGVGRVSPDSAHRPGAAAMSLFGPQLPVQKDPWPAGGGGLHLHAARAPLPAVPTPQEVKRVLESFTVAKYGIFFSLIYATGLRINEARHLETQDIDALRGVIHVRHAKGGGQRMVMLSPKLLDQLRNYWEGTTGPHRPCCSPPGKVNPSARTRRAGLCCVPRPWPGSNRLSLRTVCATASPLRSWKTRLTCAPSRSSSATGVSSPPPSTPRSPPARSRPCRAPWIAWSHRPAAWPTRGPSSKSRTS